VASPRRSDRPGSPRARLFLALDPPRATREELAEWRDGLIAGRDDLRPVAPEALHVTLVFLGWKYEKEVERIADAAFEAAEGARAATLTPTRVRPIPPRGPRLFALDLADEEDAAGSVQAAVSSALEKGRFYRPEKRPFWAHLTLARVKRGRRAAPLEAKGLPARFGAGRLTLYRSTLRPQGAVYEPLAGLELEP
jgi:RNA 2',3'-cyclic 3'-phosphodiesterase